MKPKTQVAACIFDAKAYQGPSKTVFSQLARQLLVLFEMTKSARRAFWVGPA